MRADFFLIGGLSALFLLILLARRVLKSIAKSWPWFRSLLSGDAPVQQSLNFGDFISITGFILTVLGIIVGWETVIQDNARIKLEAQIREATQDNADLHERIRTAALPREQNFAPGVDVHLELPANDAILTGIPNPEFQWTYSRHNEQVNYFVEFVRLDSMDSPGPLTSNAEPPTTDVCDFTVMSFCKTVATKPAAQRTELPLPLSSRDKISGRFLWRVKPNQGLDTGPDTGLGHGQISEWSEYGSFEIYPTLAARMQRRRLLVGTTYSDNDHFSSINKTDGRPAGHDIDLIRLLIAGCLTTTAESAIVYDPDRCRKASEAYARSRPGAPIDKDIHLPIRPFASVEDGLQALRRKEIDVFVGAVTRAKEREHEGLRFTDGYYPFRSVLYIHGEEDVNIKRWARTPRTIGVIANSTNHWLATALTGESPFGSQLTIVAFPSYWSLRNAFENRDVNGLLIDSVLGYELSSYRDIGGAEHRTVTGIRETAAWKEYQGRLGYDDEEFAIAVATDQPRRFDIKEWLSDFFYLPHHWHQASSQEDLFTPLQSALESNEIQFTLAEIRRRNDVPRPDQVK